VTGADAEITADAGQGGAGSPMPPGTAGLGTCGASPAPAATQTPRVTMSNQPPFGILFFFGDNNKNQLMVVQEQ
jgi:hypothetical protein